MSLAQRRTTLDGIEAISLPSRRASGLVTTSDDGEDGLGNHHHHTTTTNIADDNHDDRQQQQQHDGSGLASETTTIDAAAQAPAEVDDGQLAEIWKTISYDLFSSGPPKENDNDGDDVAGLLLPELQHYESFPAELGDHVMAYEVSTAKRVGEFDCIPWIPTIAT